MVPYLYEGMPRSVRLLQLSDLHIAPTKFAFADKEGQPDPFRLFNYLKRDSELQIPPDAIVISGDVGWAGVRAEYEYAEVFIKALQKQWPSARIVVAPGNHDVDLKNPTDPHHDFVELLKKVHGNEF